MEIITPSEEIARKIVCDLVDQPIKSIDRFTTGKDNYVFDVQTETDRLVVRMNKNDRQDSFRGAVRWYDLLKPKGVPLPTMRFHDVEGKKYGVTVIVMDRLQGRDLVDEYVGLTNNQKESIVTDIVNAQKVVGTLPLGSGFGYATSYEDPKLHPSWSGVMDQYMTRITSRNEKTKLIENKYIDKLATLYKKFSPYFEDVKPTPFLDDTTTKNVIVSEGKLSGIVDVDYICFGDPLFVVALTQTALLASKDDTYYTDYWIKLLNVSEEQQQALSLYSGMFALEFASTMGHTFNTDKPEKIDQEELLFLTSTFERLTNDL